MRTLLLLAVAIPFLFPAISQAQPGRRTPARPDNRPALPEDPRLSSIHREFITKAEQLGDEYARKKEWEKSRIVFEEILKLAPNYRPANDKMRAIHDALSSANQIEFTVRADEGWQDTGVVVEEGTPMRFKSSGKWLFAYESDAEGLQIPRDLQDYKLGSLIGVITDNPMPGPGDTPFTLGKTTDLSAPSGGKLWLKMHATDHQHCQGKMDVEISGNFRPPVARGRR